MQEISAMELYKIFTSGVRAHMTFTKKSNNFSDTYCRDEWDFNAARTIRENKAPHTVTYFKYCKANKLCPVRLMIFIFKDVIDLDALIEYIKSLKKKD